MRPTRIRVFFRMKMVSFLIICILGCFSCTSKTNTTDSEKELRQETTIVSEKVYPKYDMSDFNIKELAELLVKEKKAGVSNDSAFADFFRRCGMEYGEFPEERRGYLEHKFDICEGFYKIYLDQKAFIKAISIYDKSEQGDLHHSVGVEFPEEDIDRLQWMIVQLRAFGMNGEAGILEGNGLYGFYSRGYLVISYHKQQSCFR